MPERPITRAVKTAEPRLPTGVVTVLFSDIEGSTRILEEHRADAGVGLARHHELLLEAIEEASGVVCETVGDAVYGAFTRPADARCGRGWSADLVPRSRESLVAAPLSRCFGSRHCVMLTA